jgi:hypothetical protein
VQPDFALGAPDFLSIRVVWGIWYLASGVHPADASQAHVGALAGAGDGALRGVSGGRAGKARRTTYLELSYFDAPRCALSIEAVPAPIPSMRNAVNHGGCEIECIDVGIR